MSSNNEKLIAVIGATGQQGGAVVRPLQASSQFKVRALSRNPGKRGAGGRSFSSDISATHFPFHLLVSFL